MATPAASGSPRPARPRPRSRDNGDEVPRHPRTGAKRTVLHYITQLPRYLGLLFGLMTDRRVATLDKLLVGGVICYVVAPVDLIPDFIPFLGQVDDLFLLLVSLQRLVNNAGRRVVLQHWGGRPSDLSEINLHKAVLAASFFLPRRVRRRLQSRAR